MYKQGLEKLKHQLCLNVAFSCNNTANMKNMIDEEFTINFCYYFSPTLAFEIPRAPKPWLGLLRFFIASSPQKQQGTTLLQYFNGKKMYRVTLKTANTGRMTQKTPMLSDMNEQLSPSAPFQHSICHCRKCYTKKLQVKTRKMLRRWFPRAGRHFNAKKFFFFFYQAFSYGWQEWVIILSVIITHASLWVNN